MYGVFSTFISSLIFLLYSRSALSLISMPQNPITDQGKFGRVRTRQSVLQNKHRRGFCFLIMLGSYAYTLKNVQIKNLVRKKNKNKLLQWFKLSVDLLCHSLPSLLTALSSIGFRKYKSTYLQSNTEFTLAS